MPTDAEVIKQACELLAKSDELDYDVEGVLVGLLDITEKRGAMLLDREFKDVFSNLPNGTTYSISGLEKQAMKNLDLESTSWRKIGPVEVEAIAGAISIFEQCAQFMMFDESARKADKVLRRLISLEEKK
jgi:hypothetical protein